MASRYRLKAEGNNNGSKKQLSTSCQYNVDNPVVRLKYFHYLCHPINNKTAQTEQWKNLK